MGTSAVFAPGFLRGGPLSPVTHPRQMTPPWCHRLPMPTSRTGHNAYALLPTTAASMTRLGRSMLLAMLRRGNHMVQDTSHTATLMVTGGESQLRARGT